MTAPRRASRLNVFLCALLLVLLLVLPWLGARYPTYLVMHILILAVFALGFNLLFGYTGLLSFGQAGFFAVGAYGCAKILLVVPNLLAGIVGGFIGGLITGQDLVSGINPMSIIVAVIGALVLLFGFNAIARPHTV